MRVPRFSELVSSDSPLREFLFEDTFILMYCQQVKVAITFLESGSSGNEKDLK